MRPIIVYKENDGFIPLSGLMDETQTPPVFLNSVASMTATLNDSGGSPVTGLTNVAGVYVAGSNGNWQFPVPNTFDPPTGGGYTLIVDVVAGSGTSAHWELPASVQVRGQAAYSM